MVAAELLQELEVAAANVGRVKRVPDAIADAHIKHLADTFVANDTALWWWESLRVPSKRFEYGSGDGISMLLDMVRSERRVLLVVTDDADPPLALYEGEPEAIADVLRQCRFFEYALAAPDASWIVFDTHMNELIVAGRLIS
jgi:hypothetical protein